MYLRSPVDPLAAYCCSATVFTTAVRARVFFVKERLQKQTKTHIFTSICTVKSSQSAHSRKGKSNTQPHTHARLPRQECHQGPMNELHRAVLGASCRLAEFLVSNGSINVTQRDPTGGTPYIHAAWKCRSRLVGDASGARSRPYRSYQSRVQCFTCFRNARGSRHGTGLDGGRCRSRTYTWWVSALQYTSSHSSTGGAHRCVGNAREGRSERGSIDDHHRRNTPISGGYARRVWCGQCASPSKRTLR